MDTQTVLILGANGRFGHAATAAFAAAGWHVLAQMRRPPQSPVAANVQVLQTPLQDTEGLVAAARGARTVVYGVNPLYTRWDEEALPLARLGMDVAERLRATFMLPGNVYNFGDQMPALLRTDTPQRPRTRKGSSAAHWKAKSPPAATPSPAAHCCKVWSMPPPGWA